MFCGLIRLTAEAGWEGGNREARENGSEKGEERGREQGSKRERGREKRGEREGLFVCWLLNVPATG